MLGKLSVPGHPTNNNNSIIVGQGPTALTVGAGLGCLDIFSLVYSCYHAYSKVSYKNAYRNILLILRL